MRRMAVPKVMMMAGPRMHKLRNNTLQYVNKLTGQAGQTPAVTPGGLSPNPHY